MKIKGTNVNLKLSDKGVNVALWVRLDGFDFGVKKKIPLQPTPTKKTIKSSKKRQIFEFCYDTIRSCCGNNTEYVGYTTIALKRWLSCLAFKGFFYVLKSKIQENEKR